LEVENLHTSKILLTRSRSTIAYFNAQTAAPVTDMTAFSPSRRMVLFLGSFAETQERSDISKDKDVLLESTPREAVRITWQSYES
jgi:hypothetical protein